MEIAVINPQVIIQDDINEDFLKRIERYGRICYKSEKLIREDSAPGFVRNLIARGHESVIEHEKITVTSPATPVAKERTFSAGFTLWPAVPKK